MKTKRSWTLAAFVAAAALPCVLAAPAQAQSRSRYYVPNSYEDFPFNQGSVFYQYRGVGSKGYAGRKGQVTAPRRVQQPRTYQQPRVYYQAPQPTYYQTPQGAYSQAPRYYYPQAR
jgi:hypothetical protein